ncbi:hypothetical protein A5724_19335 [Mycobacterium sp. ACS1612]|nr:hypothetical protein A5724_19335 [Mycobacterium sp. ACS1612]
MMSGTRTRFMNNSAIHSMLTSLPRALIGTDSDGETRYEERELDEGDVIAHGTTAVDGYGKTPVERAKFIVDIIRVHLSARRARYTSKICHPSKRCSGARSAGARSAAPVCPPTDEAPDTSGLN